MGPATGPGGGVRPGGPTTRLILAASSAAELRPLGAGDPLPRPRHPFTIFEVRAMDDTIVLPDGSIADRIPWEDLQRLVNKEYPDPLDEDDGVDARFRGTIIAQITRGGKASWLGMDLGLGPADIRK